MPGRMRGGKVMVGRYMGLALQEDVLSQSCFASCETPTMATSSSTLASVTSSTSKPAISAKPFPSWSFSM